MRQHHGEIMEHAIRQSGIPLTRIAKQVGYSRQHLYNLFREQTLDLNLLIAVGKYIHYDFSEKISAFRKYKNQGATEAHVVEEPRSRYGLNYEEKYHKLLEDYNELLRAYNKLLRKK